MLVCMYRSLRFLQIPNLDKPHIPPVQQMDSQRFFLHVTRFYGGRKWDVHVSQAPLFCASLDHTTNISTGASKLTTRAAVHNQSLYPVKCNPRPGERVAGKGD